MCRQHGDSHISECWMGLEEWVGACQVNRNGGGDEGSNRGNVNGMGSSAGCGEKELRLAVSIAANTKQVRTTDRQASRNWCWGMASKQLMHSKHPDTFSFPLLFWISYSTTSLLAGIRGQFSIKPLFFPLHQTIYINIWKVRLCVFHSGTHCI